MTPKQKVLESILNKETDTCTRVDRMVTMKSAINGEDPTQVTTTGYQISLQGDQGCYINLLESENPNYDFVLEIHSMSGTKDQRIALFKTLLEYVNKDTIVTVKGIVSPERLVFLYYLPKHISEYNLIGSTCVDEGEEVTWDKRAILDESIFSEWVKQEDVLGKYVIMNDFSDKPTTKNTEPILPIFLINGIRKETPYEFEQI